MRITQQLALLLRACQQSTIYQAGVVELIGKNRGIAIGQACQQRQIGHIACAETQGRRLCNIGRKPRCQRLIQRLMRGAVAADQMRAA